MWSSLPKPILTLAPMAGITDSAFRLIAKQHGADVVYSEMANVSALFYRASRTLELIRFSTEEQPYVVQLFGKEPDHFAHAAKLVSQGIPVISYSSTAKKISTAGIAPPAGIDINFGCPAKKVFGHGSGAALMDKPELAKKIIQAVVANTNLPVSIKVRTEVKGVAILDFLKKVDINNLGVGAIMVHGRSYSQGFSGAIDYNSIRVVKEYFKGIVIANGGIKSTADAKKMLAETKADGVGIATGSYGNPGLFGELKKSLRPGDAEELSISKKDAILRHGEYALELKGKHGIVELRKHLLWYFRGYPNARDKRAKIVAVENLDEIREIVKNIDS